MNSPVPSPVPEPQRTQPMWLDLLHVWSLFNLAVTQSFYTRLVNQPEYLISPEVTPDSVFWVGATMTFLIPMLLMSAVAAIGRIFPRMREFALLAVVFLSVAVLLTQALQPWIVLGGLLLLVAAGGGVLFAVLYQRFLPIRQIVTVASFGILLTPLILYAEFWKSDEVSVFRMDRDSSRPRVPIVFVVFDEFPGPSLIRPDESINEVRFPHFAQLAKDTTWYRNACAVAPMTTRALPAILTGRFPSTHDAVTRKRYPQNLFQSLTSGADYEEVAFEPVSVVAPYENKVPSNSIGQRLVQARAILGVLTRVYSFDVVPTDFHTYLPEIPKSWFGLNLRHDVDRNARRGKIRYPWTLERDEQLEHFLDCIDQTPQGILYFGHFVFPHAPWCMFPSGKRYAPDSFELNRGCFPDAGPMDDELGLIQGQQRYLMQLMAADRYVGRLVERLKAVGIYDECLLIVTADHGISFRLQNDQREFTGGNTTDIARVPLFVKYPHQQQGDDRPELVQSTDILPTILELVGLHPHLPMDGLPFSDPRILERQQAQVAEQFKMRVIPAAELKQATLPAQIQERFGDGSDRWQLYRIGPHSEWLDQPLSRFRINDTRSRSVECFVSISAASDAIHQEYYIEGVLDGAIPESPVELLVAVHGVVQATTRTYSLFQFQNRWTAMLPEWSYASPAESPEIYSVESDGSLTRCEVRWTTRPTGPADNSPPE